MSSSLQPVVCRSCGKPQTWVPIYRRYYCYNCKTYPPTCPNCSSDLSWIGQYGQYYCYTCGQYPEVGTETAPQPIEHTTHAAALIEASKTRGIFPSILGLIDGFCIVVQKVVGGFPSGAVPKSPSVYANPPIPAGREAGKYIVAGIVMVLAACFFLFNVEVLAYFGFFIFSFIGPLLYLAWMWRTDRYEKEPRLYLFVVFAMGFLATVGAYVLNSWVVGPFLESLGAEGLTAPIVEETLKGLCVLWIARKMEFNDAMDGIVYGFAAGMGFAASENFFYIIGRYDGDIITSALRVFIWGFGHGTYTAMTGRWMGKMKVLTGTMKVRFILPGLIVAMTWHFIYNEVAGAILPIAGNIVWDVLLLIIVVAATRQALGEERHWGYDNGLAPIGEPVRA